MRSKLGVAPYVLMFIPLDLLVVLAILFAELYAGLRKWVRPFPSSQRRGGAKRRGGQFGETLTFYTQISKITGTMNGRFDVCL